jgi:hypothetical protein
MRYFTKINQIDKNEVASLTWPNENLHNEEMRNDILTKLKVAMILGNIEKIKCKIIFKDDMGIKMTETTIWSVCEKNIVIKSGIWIPIKRILDIEI